MTYITKQTISTLHVESPKDFDIKPERLIADKAYGSASMLGWMIEEKAIEPHIPVWDKTERKDGTFERDDFKQNEEADEYRCPADKALRSEWHLFKSPRKHVTNADTIIYRSSQRDCATRFDEVTVSVEFSNLGIG